MNLPINTTETAIVEIPLSALMLSESNVRKTKPADYEAGIASLAATIRATRLLQNLVVFASATHPGKYEVTAGERRFRALALLADQGNRPADWPVPCLIVDASEATAASTNENVQRQGMHPADEFDAFLHLFTAEGMTIDAIADAFGVTPLVVERRLTVAKAAPALIALFRKDEITTDQLIALCSTDDHELQVRVWENAMSWDRKPSDLRRKVTCDEIDVAKDVRVAFIGGGAALESAGGFIRRDLFSAEGQGGFTKDVALLDRLVVDRLNLFAKDVQDEGWAWVDVRPEVDDGELNRLGRIDAVAGELSAEDAAAMAALEAETKALNIELNGLYDLEGEFTEEQSNRVDEIETRLEAIEGEAEVIESRAVSVYPTAAKAFAGALVSQKAGKVYIVRGLVKAEDRGQVKKIEAQLGIEVSGGRETKAAGRKENTLSDALVKDLLGHRNAAAQLEIAGNAHVAKVLLAVSIIEQVRGGYHLEIPTTLHAGGTNFSFNHQIENAGFEAMEKALKKQFPAGQAATWEAVSTLPAAELDAVIAFGVAKSLNLYSGHKGYTGLLLESLGLDMAKHFTATGENYLGRVSKPLVIAALQEAGKGDDAEQLAKLKKGALTSEAEKRLAGSGWLPALLRAPKPKAEKAKAAPKKAAPKKAAKKAPTKAKPAKAAAKKKR